VSWGAPVHSKAMAVMESSSISIRQADTAELVATAAELFLEYADAIGVDLEYQGFSGELAALPEPYTPPLGALFIACVGTEVAGCVAMRPLEAGIAEMKRLYTRPQFRGLGLGKRLVESIIEAARLAGYRELRLDTLPTMKTAQVLYLQLGFLEIAPYSNRHLPGTRFYALKLS
jgi:putative acetyltransferase